MKELTQIETMDYQGKTIRRRRNFLKQCIGAGGLLLSSNVLAKVFDNEQRMISCQEYPWFTFYGREDKDWHDDLAASFAEFSSVPLAGFEPIIDNIKYIDEIIPYLKKHNLSLESLYTDPLFHDTKQAPSSIRKVLKIADAVRPLGTKIFVINPEPLDWDSEEEKSDEQLEIQAEFLNQLGAELANRDIQLAYHNHEHEIRNGAREFYYMMQNTDASNVKLCLDAHWIYRGAGNTTAILSDVLEKYIDRVAELHLRQSQNGIWTESFGDGDLDYRAIAAMLKQRNMEPLLVLEQSVEDDTSATMNAVQAHAKSVSYVKEVFSS